MTGAARVTIGMPIYNNAATLARAIASVQGQTMADWRLILSDDCSTDTSWQIATEASQNDPRITASRNEDRQVYMNFAVPLRAAETDWFVWLAADDFWAPDFLEATLRLADRAPEAVSILPRWAYQGLPDEVAFERHLPLTAPRRIGRLRQFLAAPGGSRMYGLMRRRVLQQAFPPRNMHAYDWYLMLGVLGTGPQLELSGPPLLFRHPTPLRNYSEAASRSGKLLRQFPALQMSLAALLSGRVPVAIWPDLVRLNFRLHEEYLAHIHPDRYARRLDWFRYFDFPIAAKPGRAARIAAELVEAVPERREAAGALLQALMTRRDPAAARALGAVREAGHLPGDAQAAYAAAARFGDADAQALLAQAQHDGGQLPTEEFCAVLLDAAAAGSARARDAILVAYEANALPQALRDVVTHRLAQHLR